MATPQEIQQAMQRAKAAGDESAVRGLREMLTEAYQAEADPTIGMSGLERFRAGMGKGFYNVGDAVKNLATGEAIPERAGDEELSATRGGAIGEFVGEMAATAPIGGAAGAGTRMLGKALGTRALSGLGAQGAIQGAAEGAVMGGRENFGTGAALGAAGGFLLPKALQKTGSALTRGVRASAPARALMREGVDLTPGQMNPRSSIGQLEEAATNVPILGPMIERQRGKALNQWQDVVTQRGAAPGAGKVRSLDEAYESFGPAYDTAKGFPIGYPGNFDLQVPLAPFGKTKGILQSAVADRGVMVGNKERKTAWNWLENQLSSLPGAGRKVDTLSSDDILKLRSNVRAQVRDLTRSQRFDEARLLVNAEKGLTDMLGSHLPQDAMDALNAADAQYAVYKVIEDAFARSGDNLQGLTPARLSQAVKAATEKGAYARGAEGPGGLRRLASAGKQVFDTRTPPTGARLATLGGLGYLIGAKPAAILGAGLTAAATTKAGRRVMGGMTKPQQAARAAALRARKALGPAGRRTALTGTATAGSAGLRDYLIED